MAARSTSKPAKPTIARAAFFPVSLLFPCRTSSARALVLQVLPQELGDSLPGQ